MILRTVGVIFVACILLVAPIRGDDCRHINATWNLTGFIVDPRECDGFSYCVPGDLRGNLNGEMIGYFNDADTIFDLFGSGDDVNIYLGEERITTRQGEIFARAHGTFDLSTFLFQELLVVTGGTGRYDGATGRLLFQVRLPLARTDTDPSDGPVLLQGEICTPAYNGLGSFESIEPNDPVSEKGRKQLR